MTARPTIAEIEHDGELLFASMTLDVMAGAEVIYLTRAEASRYVQWLVFKGYQPQFLSAHMTGLAESGAATFYGVPVRLREPPR